MPLRLYHIPLSPPGVSVQLALRHKGVDHRVVELLGGLHPAMLRALGFRGATVPAVRLEDGTRVQGSLAIMAALERLPGPSLYPEDPVLRRRVEDAERWAESVVQPLPRRIIRWGLHHELSQRQWFAAHATPLPLPQLTGALLTPLVPLFVRQAGAYDARVQADLAGIPALLDEIDELIADGVIGDPAQPNAADFHLAGSLALLSAFADVRPLFTGRPCLALTERLVTEPLPRIPAVLPPAWIPLP